MHSEIGCYLDYFLALWQPVVIGLNLGSTAYWPIVLSNLSKFSGSQLSHFNNEDDDIYHEKCED